MIYRKWFFQKNNEKFNWGFTSRITAVTIFGQFSWLYINWHFSHVTKCRIFTNLSSRIKVDHNFCGIFLKKLFQAPKIIFKSPKLIGQKSLSYGHLLKNKTLKFTTLRESIFQVFLHRSSPPKKTLINENMYFFSILDLGSPRNQKFGLFSLGKKFI